MYNDWFSIGPVTIHGYGVMIAIGILAAFFTGEKRAKKYGLKPEEVDNLVLVCLAVGYLFSKITYVLTNWNGFLKNPMAYLGPDGWVVYGGILGGILGAWLWCRHRKLVFTDYLNLLLPCVALAQGFGRIGCFLAGCCYGKPTDAMFGVTFPEGSLAPAGVKLIPTQLISSFADFALFYVLSRIYVEADSRKETAAWYLILYSAGRFVIEFMRGDAIRGSVGILSTSQFIGIFVFAAGIVLLARTRASKKKEESAAV